ncbi:hypothetical protein LSH36_10g10034 [Paralvinella palmiformis]|uniref:Protein kinase domain-containing protein n=1 Tax=Paralvinella palmiformis TaxID=53620 RepID=A0AAD9KDR9_9ANNE|nr:hypothetical protein LSH36_10g10034 [Paralvinella palmiformis]
MQRRLRRSRTTEGMRPDCSPRSSISDSLYQQDLADHYTVIKDLGSGTYGKVLLAKCRKTGTEVALKVLPKSSTKLKDFLREFNYSYYLSPHRAIVSTYDVAFETPTSYVFAQEHAPMGDLFEAITPQVGISECRAKVVAKSVASALEFMHSKNLVHRDIKPENILLFDAEFVRVKLMDFGMTKKAGTLVRKVSGGIPYTPPEICEALKGERYTVETSADVWAFAVLVFCMLTGNFPWELASHKDSFYAEFIHWQKRKTTKLPSQWQKFSPRMMRLFRRLMEPKPERRTSIKEVAKYFEDAWTITQKAPQDDEQETAEVDPMEHLNAMLQSHGIETTVNKKFREKRISEWILST